MSIVNKIFDAVFVINLDRSPDRLKKIDEQLKRLGINYERVAAVDGSQLSSNEIKKFTTNVCYNFCTKGSIGCAMSHLKVWEIIKEKNLETALILEDDAVFGENFESRFKNSWEQVPDDWDQVSIGCIAGCGDRNNYTFVDWISAGFNKVYDMFSKTNIKGGKNINDKIAIPDGVSGSHCYAITNKASSILLEDLTPVPYIGHIDVLMNIYGRKKFKQYAFKDGSIVSQPLSTNQSTIGSGGPPYIGNYILDKVQINNRGMTLGWLLSETFIRVGKLEFCLWDLIFIILGYFIAMYSNSSKRTVILSVSFALLLDQTLFGKPKHTSKTLVYWILFNASYWYKVNE